MRLIFRSLVLLVFLFAYSNYLLVFDDPKRFAEEIATLNQKEFNFPESEKVYLFVGSSSIRMWEDLEKRFSDKNVINMGFGGSHMSDLLYYADDLIFRHRFDKIFIYEGDNDIESGKSVKEILLTTDSLMTIIRKKRPEAEIVLITAKPSISRWSLKKNYEKLNGRFERYAKKNDNMEFADVWTPMLDANGNLMQDLFIEDDLHMNSKGYDIWTDVLSDFIY